MKYLQSTTGSALLFEDDNRDRLIKAKFNLNNYSDFYRNYLMKKIPNKGISVMDCFKVDVKPYDIIFSGIYSMVVNDSLFELLKSLNLPEYEAIPIKVRYKKEILSDYTYLHLYGQVLHMIDYSKTIFQYKPEKGGPYVDIEFKNEGAFRKHKVDFYNTRAKGLYFLSAYPLLDIVDFGIHTYYSDRLAEAMIEGGFKKFLFRDADFFLEH